MLESLVLFARKSSWKRATWMGIAFFMNGLSCISWLIMTIVPLALTVIFFLIVRDSLLRSRAFWVRGAVAITVASLALFPFLWPYYRVSVLYGFRWPPWEFALNSASIIHWFKGEPRNRVWQNFGSYLPGGHMLFPGLLAPLLAVASLQLRTQSNRKRIERRFITLLNFVIVAAAITATLAIGYGDMTYQVLGHRLFRLNDRSIKHALVIILIALVLRVCLGMPARLRRFRHRDRIQTMIDRSEQTREAIGVGVVWTVAGFLASLGANFFVNRWLHDYLFLYQSIRIPARAAMVCYLGLAVLAGIGSLRLANGLRKFVSSRQLETGVFLVLGLAFLFELHASPLRIEIGEVNPSSLALRLSQIPMTGGLVELPSFESDVSRHFYMLRAADHGKPLVNATSSFISPLTDQINRMTAGKIAPDFMDLLEKIPASYLVVHNDRLLPGWQTEYEIFLTQSLKSGHLRFINRFDGHDDLYAVVRTEPQAKSEAPIPFSFVEHEWSVMIERDESNILSPANRSQSLYRLYLATTGTLPQYADFMKDIKSIGRGVIRESEAEDRVFQSNLSQFADAWVRQEPFAQSFRHLDDTQYVDRLLGNTGITLDPHERTALIEELAGKSETRATVLLMIVADPRFVEKENARSMVLLHYFGYLHRNPGDPPDRDLSGFNFWIQDFVKQPNAARLSAAFKTSIEYWRKQEHD